MNFLFPLATSNDHLDLAASLSSAGGGTDISELDRGIDAERKQVEDRFNLGSSTSALKQLKVNHRNFLNFNDFYL